MTVCLLASFLYVYSVISTDYLFAYSLMLTGITFLMIGSLVMLLDLRGNSSLLLLLAAVSSFFILLYLLLIFVFKRILKISSLEASSVISTDLTEKYSPLASSTGMKFTIFISSKNEKVNSKKKGTSGRINIYFNEFFIKDLGDNEIKTAILHELGHFVSRRNRVNIYVIPFVFYAYFLGYSYFIATAKSGYVHTLISIPILLLMIVSFFFVVRKFPDLIENREHRSDAYAFNILGNASGIVSLLDKVQAFYETWNLPSRMRFHESLDKSLYERRVKIEKMERLDNEQKSTAAK